MNYRHAYHAGNFADVLKHLVLVQVISHLMQKEAPFRVIDLHAGPGLYDLEGSEATKTGEFRDGIARLWPEPASAASAPGWSVLEPYLSIVASCNPDGRLARYPGSPLIARRLLRPEDVLVANELHPEDHQALAGHFRRDRQVKIMGLDAWTAIKSLLPPKERRGVVLVDPPYEEPRELERMTEALGEALHRFRNGIYLLWYPVKDRKPVERFHRQIAGRIDVPVLCCELLLRRANNPDRLNGAGLLVVNPPYRLPSQLATVAPIIEELLVDDERGGLTVSWLVPEKPAAV